MSFFFFKVKIGLNRLPHKKKALNALNYFFFQLLVVPANHCFSRKFNTIYTNYNNLMLGIYNTD